jgi:hypothetical protein
MPSTGPDDREEWGKLRDPRRHMRQPRPLETDEFVLGRRTFEAFRAYWPNQANDATGMGRGEVRLLGPEETAIVYGGQGSRVEDLELEDLELSTSRVRDGRSACT